MLRTSPALTLAPFRFDVTPPLNHALLGGLVQPVVGYDDGLEAIGYVLQGAGAPIVICALDWAGLLNTAHAAWCDALARAAGTTPDRVAVHCVHQHAAPFVCFEAQAAIAPFAGLPTMFDPVFFAECLARGQAAVRAALLRPQRVTRVGHGQARAEAVASNRRVQRDANGRVIAMRRSACTDPALAGLPEGIIDPLWQTVAFYGEDGGPVVANHYYATHPMSYYRDGRVSSDFCGLARKRRQAETPGCTQIYFTGCAGNVAAGKYNDGSPAARAALTERVYHALVSAERALKPVPLERVSWRVEHVLPVAQLQPGPRELTAAIGDSDRDPIDRLLFAFQLAWLQRVDRQTPLSLSCLGLNDIAVLHLPGVMFVEDLLRARALNPARPVAVAAYGDGGPWYVPTREEYQTGGYEVEVAFCREEIDGMITAAIQRLLAA